MVRVFNELILALVACGPRPENYGTALEVFPPGQKPTWDDIQNLIDTNDVIVFSTSQCGYSKGAKHYLNRLEVPYVYMDIDSMSWQWQQHIRNLFLQKTNMKSTPRIFVKGQDLRGFTDMIALGKDEGKNPKEELLKLVNA